MRNTGFEDIITDASEIVFPIHQCDPSAPFSEEDNWFYDAKDRKIDDSVIMGMLNTGVMGTMEMVPDGTSKLTIQLTVSLPVSRYTHKLVENGLVCFENPTMYACGDSKVLYNGKLVGSVQHGKAMVMLDKLVLKTNELPHHVAFLLKRQAEVEARKAEIEAANKPFCYGFGTMELGNIGCDACFESNKERHSACVAKARGEGTK